MARQQAGHRPHLRRRPELLAALPPESRQARPLRRQADPRAARARADERGRRPLPRSLCAGSEGGLRRAQGVLWLRGRRAAHRDQMNVARPLHHPKLGVAGERTFA
eukprot:scaffold35212_cov69-Phaeocystis_antarctica.AAC.8